MIIRLWETVEKGGAGLFGPWQARRAGRAASEVRRDELLMLAQAEKDAEAIRNGELRFDPTNHVLRLSHYKSQPPSGEASSLLLAAAASADVADRLRREVNVAKALHHAEAALESDVQEPPQERPDEDWFFRWRENASQVGAEELQYLWGRVLAGEVSAPGSYSLRTLEFLRNLSKREAETVAVACRYAVEGFIFNELGSDRLEKAGLDFDSRLELEAMGFLAAAQDGISTNIGGTRSDRRILLRCNDLGLVVKLKEGGDSFSVPSHPLTQVGKQISKLGDFSADQDYVRALGEQVKSQGHEVMLARCKSVGPDEVSYTHLFTL
ncbi:DUF2806 domain-containing protein [Lysobacter sp. GCM10012299]|uniref:DUF2806 domain-containing protein n=1 Tax=Lysobacter sp. GCM10012299 TaxID=3317333 RepID=UPI00361934BF